MSLSEHPVAAAGTALASPIGGAVVGALFGGQTCSEFGICTWDYNESAALGATFVGWLFTGLVLLTNGDDNTLAVLLFAFAVGAGIGALTA